MSQRSSRTPDTIILDLKAPIADYSRAVAPVATVMDTDPGAMLSWLACYIEDKAHAAEAIDCAVSDLISSEPGISDEVMDIFIPAGERLGEALLDAMNVNGMFPVCDGKLRYQLSGVVSGSTIIFKRVT